MAADHDPIEIIRIRRARTDDDELAVLASIEVRAGALFAQIGMPEIADDDPPTPEELRSASAIVVAVDATDRPVGYARVEVVDGHAHLEQLSVDPANGRQGIGGALLDAVAAVAAGRGDREVTLTTFRDVPFNRPFYERHGYVVLAPADCGPELVERIAHEADAGLDPTTRCPMRRPIGPADAHDPVGSEPGRR